MHAVELENLIIKVFLDLERVQLFRARCTNFYGIKFVYLFIYLFNKYASNYLLIALSLLCMLRNF